MSSAVQRHKEKRKNSEEDNEEEEELKLSSSQLRKASERIQHKLRKEKWVKRVDWCKEKAQAVFWTGLAIYLVFQARLFWNFFHYSQGFSKTAILICGGILSAILVYGGFYLPYIRRQRHDIEVTHPQLIYIASALIMSIIVLQIEIKNRSIVVFWEFYSYWTIALIPILAMGYTMSMHFLPDGLLGGIVFLVANIAIIYIQYHVDQGKPKPEFHKN